MLGHCEQSSAYRPFMELECLVACGICSPVMTPTTYVIGFMQSPSSAPTASTAAATTTTRSVGIETGTSGLLPMNINSVSPDDAVDLAAGTSVDDPNAAATRTILTVGVIVTVVAVVSLLLCYLAVDRYGARMERHGRRMGAVPRKSAGMYKVSPAPSPTWDFVGSPEPPVRPSHLLGEFLTGQSQISAGHEDDVGSNAKPDVDAAAESWLGAMKLDPRERTDALCGSVLAASHHAASPDPTPTKAEDNRGASGLTQQSHSVAGPGVADVIVPVARLTMSQASTASTLGSVMDWGDVMDAQIEERNLTISPVERAFPRPEDEKRTHASTLSHSQAQKAGSIRGKQRTGSTVGGTHRPERSTPTKESREAPSHVPRTSFPTLKRVRKTSKTPPPRPPPPPRRWSSRQFGSWSPRFNARRKSTPVMPVETSGSYVQQDGRHSRNEAPLTQKRTSSHGSTRGADHITSMATDDVESMAWGIDVKPRLVSRLSGTTELLEVESATGEYVDWINPLFHPFDNDDVNNDHDRSQVKRDIDSRSDLDQTERDGYVGGGVTEFDFEAAMDKAAMDGQ